MFRTWHQEEEAVLIQMKQQGWKIPYIAYKMKRTDMGIYSKLGEMGLSKKKSNWSLEDWKKALRMYDDGYTFRQIAQKIGRTQTAVKQKFYEERRRGRL